MKFNKKWILTTAGMIVAAWTVMFALSASAKSISEKVKDAKEEVEQSKEKLEQSQQNVEEMESSKAQLEGKLEELNEELSAVSAQLESAQIELDKKQQTLAETKEQLVIAEANEVEQYENMKMRIKYMYENNSNSDMLHMILDGNNFMEILNKADFFSKMAEYDRNMLDEYTATKETIANAKIVLEQEEKALQEAVAEVEKKRTKVNHLVSQTTEEIARQETDLEEAEARALEYEKQLEEQQNTLEALKEKEAEEKRILEEQARIKKAEAVRNGVGISSAINYDSSGKVTGNGTNTNIATDKKGYSEASGTSDVKLLATIIYCEAGNQPYEGKIAVGSVVMNRINSSLFPNTMLGVLYQKSQFTPVMSGRFAIVLANNSATESCYAAAQEVLNGRNNVPDCLFFRTVTSNKSGTIIGNHVFY